MKLEFHGHDEKYVVEQTLMTLFPGELPVYEPIDFDRDDPYAVVTAEEHWNEGKLRFHAVTEMKYHGQGTSFSLGTDLRGSEFDHEGQRRWAIAACFFHCAQKLTGIQPPWGMLTGVRPDKPVTQALLEGKSPAETEAWLKEHYFVSDDRAELAMETGTHAANAARGLEPRDIALYVGIPFCPTRCVYCSFVSQSVEKSFAMVPPYVEALVKEIESGGEMVRREGLRPRAFYMGGGTPTTLTAEQMDTVLRAVERSFDLADCQEITVEAGRPDTITAEKLAVLRDHGVQRISVNPQSMEDRVLEAIGRRHSAEDIVRAMELVDHYDFPHVNMDLIAGLPEDTVEGFRRTVERCIGFGTDNITIHTLALKKGSRLLLEGLRIPGPETVREMLDYAMPALRKAGHRPYYLYRQKYMSGSFENVGWSHPGAECLYNIYIMSELCSILSFGAGGSTKMVQPGVNHIERAFNLKYPKEYIERPEKARSNQEAFAAFYDALKGAPSHAVFPESNQ